MKANVFLVVLLTVALVNLSSAQVQWFTPGVKITDLGGDLSKGNFDPFICGQFADGSTEVGKIQTFETPTYYQQYTPGVSPGLFIGAKWPYPGVGCRIATWNNNQEMVVNGIATSEGTNPLSCNQGVAFVTSGMDAGSSFQMFQRSFKMAGDAPHHGDVALNDYFQNGLIKIAIVTGILEESSSPCPELSNPNPVKRQQSNPSANNNKRQQIASYQANVLIYTGFGPVTFNVTQLFPANSPVQGIAYSSLAMTDFNDDGYDDLFMCGTVFNTVTGHDEPYSRIWYLDFQNGTDIFFRPGPQVFSQVTHCVAEVFALEPDLNLDQSPRPLSIFLSGTDGNGNRICEVWQRSTSINGEEPTWTKAANALSQVQCVTHGDVTFADFNGDGCNDMLLLGDDTSASGASMTGEPAAGSTTIYASDCNNGFLFQQRLRPLHSGGVSTYTLGKGKRLIIRGAVYNIIISGLEETGNGTNTGTWLYEWSDFMSTTVAAATSMTESASLAAAAAATTQSASLASLAAAGLLDSTTAAVAASTIAAQSSLTTAQATLSQATTAVAASTSSAAVTTSTQSTLTAATSTTSTRSTLVTSATSAQSTSINSVVTSLTSAAATALATSTGGTTIPISNDENQQRNLVLPPVEAKPNTEDGSMKVSPLLQEINRDLPAIEYQIRAKNFVEIDEYGLPVSSCPVPSGEFTLVTETSTSPAGYPITVNFFTATLCNGATILAKYTQYSAAEVITFADLPISVTGASVKLVYTISDWPFADPTNMLEIELELVLNTPAIASYIIPRDADHLLWNLQMAETLWISSILLRKAEVDGVATTVDIFPTSASNFLGVKIRVPNFLFGVAIDPSFDVLLEGDKSKKKKSSGAAIGGGVAGGIAVLVVVGVIVYFLVFKKKATASFGSSGSGASGGTA